MTPTDKARAFLDCFLRKVTEPTKIAIEAEKEHGCPPLSMPIAAISFTVDDIVCAITLARAGCDLADEYWRSDASEIGPAFMSWKQATEALPERREG